jgi:hypothetical protein
VGSDGRPQYEVPYLHVRPPRRVVGVGGEVDGAEFEATVQRANRPVQMGEAREPERPDRSMFA